MGPRHLTPHDGEPDRATGVDRRVFVACGLAAAFGAPALLTGRTWAGAAAGEVVARTRHGRVRGARADGVVVFKGIPYAGSPALDPFDEHAARRPVQASHLVFVQVPGELQR